MLSREKVQAAFEQKRDDFRSFQAAQQREQGKVEAKIDFFCSLSSADILDRLAAGDEAWPGALPTLEHDQAARLRLPFAATWASHEDARRWALTVLNDRPVLAVDGSQVPPSKDYGLPVAAVQIGWYINPHRAGQGYEKNLSFELLSPADLEQAEASGVESADWLVNQRRFEAECAKLCELMDRFAALPANERPLCFFDGSLIISFASTLRPERSAAYLNAVRSLLERSTELRVPLVAFVDSSASKDLVTLLNVTTGPDYVSLTDGSLLGSLLPAWGDRTPFFVCARRDNLSLNGRADFYRAVVFCYVRLSADRPPARVEMPLWMWEGGLAAWAVDMVRAECVASAGGYPYAIETADAVAVLQQADREVFYALLQQFAEHQGLAFTQSRKARSKQARRA